MGGRSALLFVAIAFACHALGACSVFDDARLQPIGGGGGAGGSGGSGGSGDDAGDDDGGACTPSIEVCNGVDDDCDGVGDEVDEDAIAFCSETIVNSRVSCSVDDVFTGCVRVRCLEGFLSCDGVNSNGCEVAGSECPCRNCSDDAGAEDDAGE